MKSLLLLPFFLLVSFLAPAQAPTAPATEKTQCSGITAKGAQCTRKISSGSYCYQHINSHDNSAKAVAVATANGEPAQGRTQCTGITKKGTRCSRNAAAGSTTCFQHVSK